MRSPIAPELLAKSLVERCGVRRIVRGVHEHLRIAIRGEPPRRAEVGAKGIQLLLVVPEDARVEQAGRRQCRASARDHPDERAAVERELHRAAHTDIGEQRPVVVEGEKLNPVVGRQAIPIAGQPAQPRCPG